MKQTIRSFIQNRFRAAIGPAPFDDQTSLFASRIVDSFGVLELIAFLEEQFGIDIDPARHELTEFDTVDKIAMLVASLQKPAAQR